MRYVIAMLVAIVVAAIVTVFVSPLLANLAVDRFTFESPDEVGNLEDGVYMLTGGLGYSYNVKSSLPLTQTNLPDYPTAPATGTCLRSAMAAVSIRSMIPAAIRSPTSRSRRSARDSARR